MDEKLRLLQRQSLTDPEAKDKYIALLARLAGISDEPLTLYVPVRIPERGWHASIMGIYTSKKLALKDAIKGLIEDVRDVYGVCKDDIENDALVFAKELEALCEEAVTEQDYQKLIDLYVDRWTGYTEEIQIQQDTLIWK